MSLPTEASTRKGIPIFSGLVRYFPHAIAAVAQLSRVGNDQHNPGQPLHWAKEKSSDELDAAARHLTDAAIDERHRDPDGVMAAVKLAWRALANLERMHDRGIDIFAATVEHVDYAEAAASDLTEEELRSYMESLPVPPSIALDRLERLPSTAAEYKAWTRSREETDAYIAELNRGYGDRSLDDCTPEQWDAAARSAKPL